jgi:hypothetical protein
LLGPDSLLPDRYEYGQKISQIENSLEKQAELNQARYFPVVHDHNGNLGFYCVGPLYILGDSIRYVTTGSTDGRLDNMEVARSELRELRKNRLHIGGLWTFHIKLKNGSNYNFALVQITPTGARDIGVDQIVLEAGRAWE